MANPYTMTIKEAKQEITNTLRIYLSKNELGQYEIPVEKQRPILLMGPPGIGKTAIMEQIAGEQNVALVSYTITHHTRQSAVGLPMIQQRNYNGTPYSVTEYTMSEIIASVHEKIEQTGLQEGILFLDEINCVSETLAPTMLQFLQYKTFGGHKVPEGWIIVVAGNPSAYNKSVRDFDIVTLDRLKRIDLTEDIDAWKEYAYSHHVHSAILAYLDSKRENFYKMDTTIHGEEFVTARGWEDLSRFLLACEKKGLPVTVSSIHQYLQHEEIARDFSSYYDLFRKYKENYNITGILTGDFTDSVRLTQASFDEAISVLGLLHGRLSDVFTLLHEKDQLLALLFEVLQSWKGQMASSSKNTVTLLQEEFAKLNAKYQSGKTAGQFGEESERIYLQALQLLGDYLTQSAKTQTPFETVKQSFENLVAGYQEVVDQTRTHLTNAFLFLEKTFSRGQEMVLFVTELTLNSHAVWFVSQHGCEKFYEYNKELLLDERKGELQNRIKEFLNR